MEDLMMDDALWQGILGGVGGGSTMLVVGWAALRWHLAEHFYTQAEGDAVAKRVGNVERELSAARDIARTAADRADRVERLLREDLSPCVREMNVTLSGVREELASLRTSMRHHLEALRDVQRRVQGVEERRG